MSLEEAAGEPAAVLARFHESAFEGAEFAEGATVAETVPGVVCGISLGRFERAVRGVSHL
jgi:hypothetical protein